MVWRFVVLATMVSLLVPVSGAHAGTLDFDPPGAPAIDDFTPVTLTGAPQLTSLTIAPFTIIDDTASFAGWHVLLTIPDLVNGASTIPASSITMDAPEVQAVLPATMTGVTGNASSGGFAAGEKIVTATVGNGAGTYLISPAVVKLEVPVDARAGTYTSAALIAIVSGP